MSSPPPSLVLILQAMQPADVSQPSVFTPLSNLDFFVFGLPKGDFVFFTVCFSTQNTQNFLENSKMGVKHKTEICPLTLPPGQTLTDGSLS